MIKALFKNCFSSSKALYTWGETTYGWGRNVNEAVRVPGRVGEFTDISHVAAGNYHLIFAVDNGSEVFSTGLGSSGQLGHGNNNNLEVPEPIEELRNVGISQLAAGLRHSLALSQRGDVYSWGFAGRNGGLFNYIPFIGSSSPVGHAESGNVQTPRLIETLNEDITQIAAGRDISLAVGRSGKVYGWGHLQALSSQPSSTPIELEEINYFLHSHHANVKKVQSTGLNAIFLLDDGRIYVIGKNEGGLFATRKNHRVVLDYVAEELTPIIDEDLHGQKIVDFEASDNSLIFRTEAGKTYYSGMYIKSRPELFPAQVQVKSIFATHNSVGIIAEDGKVSYLNDSLIEGNLKKGEVFVNRNKNIRNAVSVGGAYLLRYALIEA